MTTDSRHHDGSDDAAREEALLRRRARELAALPADRSASAGVELLEFRLGRERYAVDERFVDAVGPLRNLTPLPCVPDVVRGVVHLRGRVLPVYDLRRLLRLADSGLTDLHHVVVVSAAGCCIGLLADAVVGVITVPAAALLSPPAGLAAGGLLRAATADGLLLLDGDRVLADPALVVDVARAEPAP